MRPPHPVFTVILVLVAAASGVAAADGKTAITHQGDAVVLDAARDQHVTGTTPFDRDTVIGVRVKSVGDTHPFLVSKAVRVDQNGSFDVAFDLSELAPLRGGPVAVVIRHNESTIHQVDGVLVTKNMPENSTLTYDPETPETTTTSETAVTSPDTPDGPLTGLRVPGLGVTAGVLALLAVGLLARR